jgi:hypothetical protein
MIPPDQHTDSTATFQTKQFYTVPEEPLTVAKLIETASSNDTTLLVPDLQRPFVWEPEGIMLAIDSLLRGWPLGSFVFWRFSPKQEALAIGMQGFCRHAVPGDDPTRKRTRFERSDFQNPNEVVRLVLDGQQRIQSFILAFAEADGLSWLDRDWMRHYYHMSLHGRKWDFPNETCGPARIYLNLSALAAQLQIKNPDEITYFGPDGERDQQSLIWVLREKCNPAYTTFPLKILKEWPDNIALARLSLLWKRAGEKISPQRMLEELGVIKAEIPDYDALEKTTEFILKRLVDIREQLVSRIEIREKDTEENLESYNSAIINVFTRLNTAGERLTREEIAFSWIKRGWTTSEGPDQSAEKCFEDLRDTLKNLNVELTSDQLVRTISVIWAVLQREGALLRQEDYLGGNVTLKVAEFMHMNWQEISMSLIKVGECCKRHEVTFGDHMLSTLPLSLLASFRMSIHSPVSSSLTQSTSRSGFDEIMDTQFLRFTLCAEISGCFQQRPGLLEKLAKDLKCAAKASLSEIPILFQKWVAETGSDCKLDFEPARNRREVTRYRQFLRAWHQISQERKKASNPFHVDHVSGRQERLEVDHVVSVALFEELIAEWSPSKQIDTDAIVNRLGNCLLLTKGHNISKSKGSISDHFKKITTNESREHLAEFLAALQIPDELANPRESLARFEISERIQKLEEAIENREKLMKRTFIDFAHGRGAGLA